MKEIMLIAIGAGAGFAICGCLMFYVMAAVTRGNSKIHKYNEDTVELMRERNEIDQAKAEYLEIIANKLK